jgi:hypothetical protein
MTCSIMVNALALYAIDYWFKSNQVNNKSPLWGGLEGLQNWFVAQWLDALHF